MAVLAVLGLVQLWESYTGSVEAVLAEWGLSPPGCVYCPVPVIASLASLQSVKTDKIMFSLHLLPGATLAAWWLSYLAS